MRAILALCLAVALAPLARAEIVEEETWYNADGKVVKTVKRTLTGADARRTPDWEPAWVRRERERGTVRRTTYYASRRYAPYYGGTYYGARYCYPFRGYYYGSRRTSVGGFRGFYHNHGGKTRWGIGYRGPGVSIRFVR